LHLHEKSLVKTLKALYPNHPWDTSKFKGRSEWTLEDQRMFFNRMKEELHIENPEDWYYVRKRDLAARGGTRILRQYGSVVNGMNIYGDCACN
jgi:hypothetical protein